VSRSEELFAAASRILPGGVDSPVRAFRSVGGTPRFIARAHGPYLVDADGNELVDLVASWGPALLGHAHPEVVAAVQEAAARGLGFGAPTEGEAELASLVAERFARAGRAPIERLRLVSTGTEATMTAIRIARGATGRPLLVKFAGHYHGHSDALLAEAGSGVATQSLPGSAGVTAATAAETVVLPFNDLDAVRALLAARGGEVAAIIVESAAANMGVVAPDPGYPAALAELAHTAGALLIVDEVLTGFRSGPAGYWGVEVDGGHGYAPDLVTFGKVIGGGLPVAAVGGRADLMDLLAPLGPVYQAGTLSGNPVAVAAGLATLRLADDAAYAALARAADAVADGVSAALAAAGVEHAVARAGTLFSFAFRAEAPRDYDEVRAQEAFRYPPFFHALLDAGVAPPPSLFEAWFVTAAHDDAAIGRILDALPAAARAAAAARPV